MARHARLSPSSAFQWTTCTAAPGAQDGTPNESSEASRDGTMCHQMSEEILLHGYDPQSYLGRTMVFWIHPESDSNGEDWLDTLSQFCDPNVEYIAEVIVTQEHIDAVVAGTEYVLQQHALHGGELMAEQRVPIGHFTGEAGAEGTTDVLMLTPKTLVVSDFKYGRKKVFAYDVLMPEHVDFVTDRKIPEKVRANLQMASYALGALEKYGLFYDWTHVTMTIIQPFVQHVSEYTCTIDELLEVRDFLALKARETRDNPQFKPTVDACHFCRASGNCEAQTKMVVDMALDGFTDIETARPAPINESKLGTWYALLPLVNNWCESVALRVYQELSEGNPVIRDDGLAYKLVEGKMGGREWKDEAVVENAMLKLRVPEVIAYEKKLISPAKTEKLATPKKAKKGQPAPPPPAIAPTIWERLQEFIRQEPGKPAVALETDPRPAISKLDGFDDVGLDADLNSDLF